MPPGEAAAVEAALALVHLSHAAGRYPAEISGGMKQRVGTARALAIEPRMLLPDEPFGALDALTRASLQDELANIVAATGATVLMVTPVGRRYRRLPQDGMLHQRRLVDGQHIARRVGAGRDGDGGRAAPAERRRFRFDA